MLKLALRNHVSPLSLAARSILIDLLRVSPGRIFSAMRSRLVMGADVHRTKLSAERLAEASARQLCGLAKLSNL